MCFFPIGFSRRQVLVESEDGDGSRPVSAKKDDTLHFDFEKQEVEKAPVDIDQVGDRHWLT